MSACAQCGHLNECVLAGWIGVYRLCREMRLDVPAFLLDYLVAHGYLTESPGAGQEGGK
jgi:hypothetical protein